MIMVDWIMIVYDFMIKQSIKLYKRVLIFLVSAILLIWIDSIMHISEFIFTSYQISTIKSITDLSKSNLNNPELVKKLSIDLKYYSNIQHPYNIIRNAETLKNEQFSVYKVLLQSNNFFSVGRIFSAVGLYYMIFIVGIIFGSSSENRSFGNIIGMTIFSFIIFLIINSLPNLSCGDYGRIISNFIYQILFSLIYFISIGLYVMSYQEKKLREIKVE